VNLLTLPPLGWAEMAATRELTPERSPDTPRNSNPVMELKTESADQVAGNPDESKELIEFRPSSAKSVVLATESMQADIGEHLKGLSLSHGAEAASSQLKTMYDSIVNNDIADKNCEAVCKAMTEMSEKLIENIDVTGTEEEFASNLRKLEMIRTQCEVERNRAVAAFKQGVEGRLASIKDTSNTYLEVCSATAERTMDMYLKKVQTLVAAEDLVMNHEFKKHGLMIEARAKVFNQDMSEQERHLKMEHQKEEHALDTEKKKEEAAHEKELKALEAARQKAAHEAEKQKQKDEADHAKQMRALEAQQQKDAKDAEKQRKKDEDDHAKHMRALEAQRAKEEADAEKRMKKDEEEAAKEKHALAKQAEKDAAEIEKQLRKEKAADEKAQRSAALEATKAQAELDKLIKKGQLDDAVHARLRTELAEQMDLYKIEYDMARTAMQAAIQKGRACTMTPTPPRIDFTAHKVIPGNVAWCLKS